MKSSYMNFDLLKEGLFIQVFPALPIYIGEKLGEPSWAPATIFVLLSSFPCVQCAAVIVYLGQIITAPQEFSALSIHLWYLMYACQGSECGLTSSPPTILLGTCDWVRLHKDKSMKYKVIKAIRKSVSKWGLLLLITLAQPKFKISDSWP